MAFKNVYMTEEDKSRLLAADIPDPAYKRRKLGEGGEKYWTYDKEAGHILLDIGVIDREDYGKKMYILFLGELNKEHMVEMVLEGGGLIKSSEEDKKNGINFYTEWELVDAKIPHRLLNDKKKIFEMFIEAMGAFAVNGDPKDEEYDVKAIIHDKGGLINE
jgi:hypothetical protein